MAVVAVAAVAAVVVAAVVGDADAAAPLFTGDSSPMTSLKVVNDGTGDRTRTAFGGGDAAAACDGGRGDAFPEPPR